MKKNLLVTLLVLAVLFYFAPWLTATIIGAIVVASIIAIRKFKDKILQICFFKR